MLVSGKRFRDPGLMINPQPSQTKFAGAHSIRYHQTVNKLNDRSNSYIKFLQCVQALREKAAFPTLDPIEERLLNQLASKWYLSQEITVSQAMEMSSDISPATAHRRLQGLKAKGMLTLTEFRIDNRVRHIHPTQLTLNYFAKLGRCLHVALRD